MKEIYEQRDAVVQYVDNIAKQVSCFVILKTKISRPIKVSL